jgi:hypothetical protein
MFRELIALSALISASAASAADWTLVAKCGDLGQERLYSYDAGSVARNASSVAVKMKGDYSKSIQKGVSESEMTWVFDCGQRMWAERSRTVYDSDHHKVAAFDNPSLTMRIVPASVADKVFTVVCA